MGTFLTLAILPANTDVACEKAVEDATEWVMEPTGRFMLDAWQHERDKWEWDWFQCIRQEWVALRTGWGLPNFEGTPEGQPLMVFPVDQVAESSPFSAVITPSGDWHGVAWTGQANEHDSTSSFVRVCREYSGHFAVVVKCHS